MTEKHPKQTTTNAGPASQKGKRDTDEFDTAGNVATKGQDPSPDNRQRGETSDKG
jgi:hypothetical protein